MSIPEDDIEFFRNAMYGHDETETEETQQYVAPPTNDGVSFVADRDTVLIKDAAGNEVRVPSMAYVRRQNETIEAQARTIRFLTSRERMMRQAINAHTQDIKDLWKETERKWD